MNLFTFFPIFANVFAVFFAFASWDFKLLFLQAASKPVKAPIMQHNAVSKFVSSCQRTPVRRGSRSYSSLFLPVARYGRTLNCPNP